MPEDINVGSFSLNTSGATAQLDTLRGRLDSVVDAANAAGNALDRNFNASSAINNAGGVPGRAFGGRGGVNRGGGLFGGGAGGIQTSSGLFNQNFNFAGLTSSIHQVNSATTALNGLNTQLRAVGTNLENFRRQGAGGVASAAIASTAAAQRVAAASISGAGGFGGAVPPGGFGPPGGFSGGFVGGGGSFGGSGGGIGFIPVGGGFGGGGDGFRSPQFGFSSPNQPQKRFLPHNRNYPDYFLRQGVNVHTRDFIRGFSGNFLGAAFAGAALNPFLFAPAIEESKTLSRLGFVSGYRPGPERNSFLRNFRESAHAEGIASGLDFQDIGDAAYALRSAGVAPREVIGGAFTAAKLAAVADSNSQDTSNLLAYFENQFEKRGIPTNIRDLGDFAATTLSSYHVPNLKGIITSSRYALGPLSSNKISPQESFGLIGQLFNLGYTGQQGGTNIRNLLDIQLPGIAAQGTDAKYVRYLRKLGIPDSEIPLARDFVLGDQSDKTDVFGFSRAIQGLVRDRNLTSGQSLELQRKVATYGRSSPRTGVLGAVAALFDPTFTDNYEKYFEDALGVVDREHAERSGTFVGRNEKLAATLKQIGVQGAHVASYITPAISKTFRDVAAQTFGIAAFNDRVAASQQLDAEGNPTTLYQKLLQSGENRIGEIEGLVTSARASGEDFVIDRLGERVPISKIENVKLPLLRASLARTQVAYDASLDPSAVGQDSKLARGGGS